MDRSLPQRCPHTIAHVGCLFGLHLIMNIERNIIKCISVIWCYGKCYSLHSYCFFFVFFTAVCCAVLNNICLFLRCVGVEEVGEKERCRGAREKGTVMIMCSCVREGLFVQHSVTA